MRAKETDCSRIWFYFVVEQIQSVAQSHTREEFSIQSTQELTAVIHHDVDF